MDLKLRIPLEDIESAKNSLKSSIEMALGSVQFQDIMEYSEDLENLLESSDLSEETLKPYLDFSRRIKSILEEVDSLFN